MGATFDIILIGSAISKSGYIVLHFVVLPTLQKQEQARRLRIRRTRSSAPDTAIRRTRSSEVLAIGSRHWLPGVDGDPRSIRRTRSCSLVEQPVPARSLANSEAEEFSTLGPQWILDETARYCKAADAEKTYVLALKEERCEEWILHSYLREYYRLSEFLRSKEISSKKLKQMHQGLIKNAVTDLVRRLCDSTTSIRANLGLQQTRDVLSACMANVRIAYQSIKEVYGVVLAPHRKSLQRRREEMRRRGGGGGISDHVLSTSEDMSDNKSKPACKVPRFRPNREGWRALRSLRPGLGENKNWRRMNNAPAPDILSLERDVTKFFKRFRRSLLCNWKDSQAAFFDASSDSAKDICSVIVRFLLPIFDEEDVEKATCHDNDDLCKFESLLFFDIRELMILCSRSSNSRPQCEQVRSRSMVGAEVVDPSVDDGRRSSTADCDVESLLEMLKRQFTAFDLSQREREKRRRVERDWLSTSRDVFDPVPCFHCGGFGHAEEDCGGRTAPVQARPNSNPKSSDIIAKKCDDHSTSLAILNLSDLACPLCRQLFTADSRRAMRLTRCCQRAYCSACLDTVNEEAHGCHTPGCHNKPKRTAENDPVSCSSDNCKVLSDPHPGVDILRRVRESRQGRTQVSGDVKHSAGNEHDGNDKCRSRTDRIFTENTMILNHGVISSAGANAWSWQGLLQPISSPSPTCQEPKSIGWMVNFRTGGPQFSVAEKELSESNPSLFSQLRKRSGLQVVIDVPEKDRRQVTIRDIKNALAQKFSKASAAKLWFDGAEFFTSLAEDAQHLEDDHVQRERFFPLLS